MLTRFLCGRTVWEIKQRTIVDMAADRGAFIDQSQSLNIHLENPNFGKLTSLHFYTWRKVSAGPRPPAHAPAPCGPSCRDPRRRGSPPAVPCQCRLKSE